MTKRLLLLALAMLALLAPSGLALAQPAEVAPVGPPVPTNYADQRGQVIRFSQGPASFADRVQDFRLGDPAPTSTEAREGIRIIGIPDNSSISLGCQGSVVVEFTDNALVDVEGPDLWVYEIGPDVEAMDVEISANGMQWVSAGRVEGSTSELDIGPYAASGEHYRFVKLTDGATYCGGGDTAGADIDAVGAIGSVAATVGFGPVADFQSPWLWAAMALGLLGGLFGTGINFVPAPAELRRLIERLTGRDSITEEELAAWQRALGTPPPIGAPVESFGPTEALVAPEAEPVPDRAPAAPGTESHEPGEEAALKADEEQGPVNPDSPREIYRRANAGDIEAARRWEEMKGEDDRSFFDRAGNFLMKAELKNGDETSLFDEAGAVLAKAALGPVAGMVFSDLGPEDMKEARKLDWIEEGERAGNDLGEAVSNRAGEIWDKAKETVKGAVEIVQMSEEERAEMISQTEEAIRTSAVGKIAGEIMDGAEVLGSMDADQVRIAGSAIEGVASDALATKIEQGQQLIEIASKMTDEQIRAVEEIVKIGANEALDEGGRAWERAKREVWGGDPDEMSKMLAAGTVTVIEEVVVEVATGGAGGGLRAIDKAGDAIDAVRAVDKAETIAEATRVGDKLGDVADAGRVDAKLAGAATPPADVPDLPRSPDTGGAGARGIVPGDSLAVRGGDAAPASSGGAKPAPVEPRPPEAAPGEIPAPAKASEAAGSAPPTRSDGPGPGDTSPGPNRQQGAQSGDASRGSGDDRPTRALEHPEDAWRRGSEEPQSPGDIGSDDTRLHPKEELPGQGRTGTDRREPGPAEAAPDAERERRAAADTRTDLDRPAKIEAEAARPPGEKTERLADPDIPPSEQARTRRGDTAELRPEDLPDGKREAPIDRAAGRGEEVRPGVRRGHDDRHSVRMSKEDADRILGDVEADAVAERSRTSTQRDPGGKPSEADQPLDGPNDDLAAGNESPPQGDPGRKADDAPRPADDVAARREASTDRTPARDSKSGSGAEDGAAESGSGAEPLPAKAGLPDAPVPDKPDKPGGSGPATGRLRDPDLPPDEATAAARGNAEAMRDDMETLRNHPMDGPPDAPKPDAPVPDKPDKPGGSGPATGRLRDPDLPPDEAPPGASRSAPASEPPPARHEGGPASGEDGRGSRWSSGDDKAETIMPPDWPPAPGALRADLPPEVPAHGGAAGRDPPGDGGGAPDRIAPRGDPAPDVPVLPASQGKLLENQTITARTVTGLDESGRPILHPHDEVTVPIGPHLNRGSFSDVFASTEGYFGRDPENTLVRISKPITTDAGLQSLRADKIGREALGQVKAEIASPDVLGTFEIMDKNGGRRVMEVVENITVGDKRGVRASDVLEDRAMNLEEAIAYDRGTRALNQKGYVSVDLHEGNFTLIDNGDGTRKLGVFDPGGIMPVKGNNPEIAREIQSLINSPGPDAFRIKERFAVEAIREDVRALLQAHVDGKALGIDLDKFIFKPDMGRKHALVGELFSADDPEALYRQLREAGAP